MSIQIVIYVCFFRPPFIECFDITMSQENVEQPIFIENLSQQRRHWNTATQGDAVHRFPVQLEEIWNQYNQIGTFDAADIQAMINDGDTDTLGIVTLRKNKTLTLVPGSTTKYQLTLPDLQIAHVIPATEGKVSPVAGDVGPVTTATAAPSGITGYTPVIVDANGVVYPMLASLWVIDGINACVEFPYGVPSTMDAPFVLTYYEYTGDTGGRTTLDAHESRPLEQKDVDRRAENSDYDIIICGAGTAGSLLTHQLASRYPDAKILLLDIGQDDVREAAPNADPANDWGQLPRTVMGTLGEGAYMVHGELKTSDTDPSARGQIHDPLGGTLGGTSAANAMVWNRGTKKGTYDRWEERVGSEFGFNAMNESYKVIENRSQDTLIYGTPGGRYWTDPPVAPPAPQEDVPGRRFNSAYHGDSGRVGLSQNFIRGPMSAAIDVVLQTETLGTERSAPFHPTDQMYLDEEDPSNPVEHTHYTPTTQYDQSSSTFTDALSEVQNPYPGSTPGYTKVPAPPGITRGPEYAGYPQTIRDGMLLGDNFPKTQKARCYAAPAYLYPILDNVIPHNVTVKTRAFIKRLLFTNPQDPTECTGVEWVEDGWHVMNLERSINRNGPQYTGTASDVDTSELGLKQAVLNQASLAPAIQAFATLDIWLCLGAKNSPKQLQLAGIGDAKMLDSIRKGGSIPLRTHLPGVGRGVQDTFDTAIGWLHEQNGTTELPFPFPAGGPAFLLGQIMGLADPQNPLDPVNTTSISGVSFQEGQSIRIRTNPSKTYTDMTLLCNLGDIASGIGSSLWQDQINLLQGVAANISMEDGRPVWNKHRWGYTDPYGTQPNHLNTHGLIAEYFDMSSAGEVAIQSSNPFDDAMYAPAMGGHDEDVEAMVAGFENTILPLLKGMAKHKFGIRGPATYVGQATAGGAQDITLLPVLVPNPARDSVLPFVDYDTASTLSGWTIQIVSGTGAGQYNLITVWSGAGSYIAAVVVPWGTAPDATSVYALNPPGASPLDTMPQTGRNSRAFARLLRPNGDNCLAPYAVDTLGADPLGTTDQSTVITVAHTAHGLSVDDIIRITGADAVGGVASNLLNEYHVVDAVTGANEYEIVLFWNRTPIGGPGSPQVASPGATSTTTGGGSAVVVEKLTFSEARFRKWVELNYFSGWHKCCSCKMGTPEDTTAVVDTRARVYNTKGLRVADASIFPVKPNANTMAPTYGITQRLFELISVEEYDGYLL